MLRHCGVVAKNSCATSPQQIEPVEFQPYRIVSVVFWSRGKDFVSREKKKLWRFDAPYESLSIPYCIGAAILPTVGCRSETVVKCLYCCFCCYFFLHRVFSSTAILVYSSLSASFSLNVNRHASVVHVVVVVVVEITAEPVTHLLVSRSVQINHLISSHLTWAELD